MTTINSDYSAINNEYYLAKTRNLNQTNTTSRYQGSATNVQNAGYNSGYVSQKGNTCTDGAEDGKVGFFSALGNIIQGVGKCAVNMVKGIIQHPIKSLLTVGACCIPIVGPVIACGLGAYGLYKGTTTIMNGVSIAMNATNDAQAKDAWEAVGEGGFTTGVSMIALKGGASQLKAQLNGGSTTVTAVKSAKANGADTGEIAKIAVEEGVKETASNMVKVAETVYEKGSKIIDKGKEYYASLKDGTLKETISQDVSKLAQSAGNKTKEIVDGVKKAKDEITAKKSQTKTSTEDIVKEIKQKAELDGAEVTETKTGGFEVKYKDGTVEKYNSKGVIREKVSGDTTRTYDSKGEITKYEQKTSQSEGSRTIEEQTTMDMKNTTTKTTQKNTVDGKETIEYQTTTKTNNKTKITTQESSAVAKDGATITYSERGVTQNGKFTGVKTENGTTRWYENGLEYSNPSLITKARINYKSTNAGVKLDQFIGDGSTTIANVTISPKQAEYFGTLLLENQ